MSIIYSIEPDLPAEEFVDVLVRSGLSVRRPVDDIERIGRMIEYASIVVCARDEGKLVGISRAVTDYSYCCYLSDLAVDKAYQGKGIGQKLIALTQETAGEETMLLLLEAPMAAGYYKHVGFEKSDNAWIIPRKR